MNWGITRWKEEPLNDRGFPDFPLLPFSPAGYAYLRQLGNLSVPIRETVQKLRQQMGHTVTYQCTSIGSSQQSLAQHRLLAAVTSQYHIPLSAILRFIGKRALVAALTVISIRPTGLPPAVTSKNTIGLDILKAKARAFAAVDVRSDQQKEKYCASSWKYTDLRFRTSCGAR